MTTNKNNDQSNNGEEMVTMKKSELQGMIDASVKKGLSRGLEKPKRVTERVARLRFHEDKPVIWYGNVREKKDVSTGKMVAWMDIRLEGDDKPITVEYLAFLNSPNSVLVKIVSKKMEEFRSSEGFIRTVNPDPANVSGKSKNFSSQETEAEVVRREYTSVVEVLEGPHQGKTYTVVDNDALNK